MTTSATLLLLGAGELGRELVIAARRLGLRVVAADRYPDAPAMQLADSAEVFSPLDGDTLEAVVRRIAPDYIVPEFEAVSIERLLALEEAGFRVIPTAEASALTSDREAMRGLIGESLGLRTPVSRVVASEDTLREACDEIGYPAVVKPLRTSSGRGHSVVTGVTRVGQAWEYALAEAEDEGGRVMVEEFVEFESEITLLVVREWDGTLHFGIPIGHRQESGDYRESWMPVPLDEAQVAELHRMAGGVVERLGGAGVFGVEFFLAADGIYLTEVTPRPHDTALVTLVGQEVSQFDLHLRALLGLPIPEFQSMGPAASAVILANRKGRVTGYEGVDRALLLEGTRIHLFGKPEAWSRRRMGVALARAESLAEARTRALEAASRVDVVVE